MKKFSKIISLVTAGVLAVSVGALAACDSGSGYGSKASAEAANKIVENLAKQDTKSVSVNGKVTQGTDTMNLSADVNYASGNADVSMSEPGIYHYAFMRDWKMYVAEDSKTEITDFSSVALELGMDLKESAKEQLGEMTDLMFTQIPTYVNLVLSSYNGVLISYATAANAVAYKSNTLTVDYNLAVYNTYNDIKAVVDGIELTTTVGDILGNETVKKYMQVFTELVTVDQINSVVDMAKAMLANPENPNVGVNPASETDGDVYPDTPDTSDAPDTAEIMAALGGVVGVVDTLLDAVKPDANSSTYDYLVKLIGSDELKATINEAIGEDVITKKITEYTVGEILGLANNTTDETVLAASLASIKAMYGKGANYITAEAVTVNDVSVSGVVLTYTVGSDFKLSSQTFAANIVAGGKTTAVDFTVTYNAAEVTLQNVSVK